MVRSALTILLSGLLLPSCSAMARNAEIRALMLSPAVAVQMTPSTTTLTVISSLNPGYPGQGITITATLAGNSAGASGEVTFSDQYHGSDPLQPILEPSATLLGNVALANGIASFTTTQLAAGTHTIVASYGGDANNFASMGTFVQVVNVPFTVTNGSSNLSLTVTSGQSGTISLTVTPANNFNGPVTFSCYGAPTNVSCAFSPATVVLNSANASTTMLTVSTTGSAPAIASVARISPATILACGLPLLGLLGIAPMVRKQRVLLFAIGALALSGAVCLGCGGGTQANLPKAAPGTYPFYIVATSGQNETVNNFQVIVQ